MNSVQGPNKSDHFSAARPTLLYPLDHVSSLSGKHRTMMVDCCSLWFSVCVSLFLFLVFNFFCSNNKFVTFSFSPLVLMFCWKSEMLVWIYSPACAAHVKQPLSYKCLVYTASLVRNISHNLIVTHVRTEVRQTHHLVLKHLVILRTIGAQRFSCNEAKKFWKYVLWCSETLMLPLHVVVFLYKSA